MQYGSSCQRICSIKLQPLVNDHVIIVVVAYGVVVNVVDHTNEKVDQHRARLVLGWMTSPDWQTTSVFNQPTQPGHPFLGRHNEYW